MQTFLRVPPLDDMSSRSSVLVERKLYRIGLFLLDQLQERKTLMKSFTNNVAGITWYSQSIDKPDDYTSVQITHMVIICFI